MIFVWGTKARFPRKGYAASFCPFCRDVREFEVCEVRRVSHVYYVPLGKGKLVGHRLECQECTARILMGDAPIQSTTPRRSGSLPEAIQATNPDIRELYAKRLELEAQIRAGKVPTDEQTRWLLLFEPFEVLAPEMERGCAETRLDLPSTLGCLGTLVAVILSVAIAEFLSEMFDGQLATEDWLIWAILGTGLAGTVFTLWQLYLGSRRWLERKMVPHLCRSLSPLRPTSEEILQIIARFKAKGMKFAKFLRVSAFNTSLNAVGPVPPASTTPLTPE
jgi:hypothetical protein